MINLKNQLTAEVNFTGDELEKIMVFFCPTSLAKGQKLLFPGKVSEDIAFVTSGCLMLTHTGKDKVQILELFSKDYFVMEIVSFLKRTPAEFTIEAVVDTVLYILPRKYYNQLYELVPKWERFMRLLIEKICLYLAWECLEFRVSTNEEKYQRLINERPFLFQELPQYIIANYLCMTPEGLSKLRGRLTCRK